MTDLPIACSLDAGSLAARRDEMRAVPLLGARVQLRFAADSRAAVERIVAAESECCPFLTMRLAQEDDALVLTVDAPRGAEAVLAGMVEAFAG
jgi:hypothetical protein